MSITPVTPNSAAFTNIDDIRIRVDFARGALKQGRIEGGQNYLDAKKNGMSTVAVQRALNASRLIAVNAQINSTTLADAGNSVVLGSTLEAGRDVRGGFASLGVQIATEERHTMASVTYDKDGRQTGTSAKALATTADMAKAAAGTLDTPATADGVETRSVANAGGGKTVYTVYTQEKLVTARLDDLKALQASFMLTEKELQKDVVQDTRYLQAFTGELLDLVRRDDELEKSSRRGAVQNQVQQQSDIRLSAEGDRVRQAQDRAAEARKQK